MNLKFSTNVALAYNVSAAWRSGGLKCTNVELKTKVQKRNKAQNLHRTRHFAKLLVMRCFFIGYKLLLTIKYLQNVKQKQNFSRWNLCRNNLEKRVD